MNIILRGLAIGTLSLMVSHANAASLFPEVSDNTHATPQVSELFHSIFVAKSEHSPEKMMGFFAKDPMAYFDTNLGWAFGDNAALKAMLKNYMPKWPKSALSYPTRISGNSNSALVQFTDTPELFGGEIRTIGVVDFKDGKVVRWADYWESRSFGSQTASKMRTPADHFPDLRYELVGDGASPMIEALSQKLADALESGDTAAAADLFSDDAQFEDMALQANVRGKTNIARYLSRVVDSAPYMKGASVAHVVGSDQGGGYEWVNKTGDVKRGVIALDLDESSKIVRFTTVWDNSQMKDESYHVLAASTAP